MTLEVMANVFEGLQSNCKAIAYWKKLKIARDYKLVVMDFLKSCSATKRLATSIYGFCYQSRVLLNLNLANLDIL